MHNGVFRISWLIGAVLCSCLLGLVLAKLAFSPDIVSSLWLGALITSPLVLKKKFLALVPCLLLGFALGYMRGGQMVTQLAKYQSFFEQDIVLLGHVQTDPVYTESGQTEFYLASVENEAERLPGRVRVRSFNAAIKRGDIVEVSGKLRSGFASWQASMYYADVVLQQNDVGVLSKFRQHFIAAIYSSLPDPEASLGLGFLIGVRTLLPEDLEEDLSRTGLTHIVAVSGYNLTILVLSMRKVFAARSRYVAVMSSLFLLAGFLLITGSSPSVVRASAVSVLSLLAWYYGRNFNAVLLLLLSAAITAFANPFYIWGDVGWYLSFLAFFGVLVLAPLVTEIIYKNKQPRLFGQIFIETTMAQIMTMPLILMIFGELSVIALVANMCILPLVPLAMLVTFLAGITAMWFQPLAWLFVVPTKFLLSFITNMIQLLGDAPWALQAVTLSKSQFMVTIMFVFIIWRLLFVKVRRRRLDSEESAIIADRLHV